MNSKVCYHDNNDDRVLKSRKLTFVRSQSWYFGMPLIMSLNFIIFNQLKFYFNDDRCPKNEGVLNQA